MQKQQELPLASDLPVPLDQTSNITAITKKPCKSNLAESNPKKQGFSLVVVEH